jgi:hypothetical protein
MDGNSQSLATMNMILRPRFNENVCMTFRVTPKSLLVGEVYYSKS